MTTIYAAAALRDTRLLATAALIALGAGLAGCAADSTLLGSSGPAATLAPSPALAQPGAPVQPQTQTTRVAIAPIIGAPETVAQQLTTSLSQSLTGQGVSVVPAAGQPTDYTVRGYIVAARERTGTKVSYIWDVTNPTGQRVNRITGEEVITGSNSRDPWSSVSPQIVQTISQKTASSLGAWLPSQRPQPAAQPEPAVASAPVAATPAAARVASAAPAVASSTTTGSIPNSGVTAHVPRVAGAPGDGNTSLAAALAKELTRNGIGVSQAPATSTHTVEGRVKLGAAAAGKQPIEIDWVVKNARGEDVGKVSQKNEIQAGSLNGSWGPIADAAASAAAQGVMRLLQQQPKAVN